MQKKGIKVEFAGSPNVQAAISSYEKNVIAEAKSNAEKALGIFRSSGNYNQLSQGIKDLQPLLDAAKTLKAQPDIDALNNAIGRFKIRIDKLKQAQAKAQEIYQLLKGIA